MPSWAHLSEADRWALVHFMKTLAGEFLSAPSSVIDVPPEPPNDRASVELGRALFDEHCSKCHGPLGHGDGPTAGIDSYPNLQRSPYEQPMRHALTLESDPTFITGWGAGNIVADPMRRSSAEDLTAQGFGTLRARPRWDQEVEALGLYDLGSYRVMFRRVLEPNGAGAAVLTSRHHGERRLRDLERLGR